MKETVLKPSMLPLRPYFLHFVTWTCMSAIGLFLTGLLAGVMAARPANSNGPNAIPFRQTATLYEMTIDGRYHQLCLLEAFQTDGETSDFLPTSTCNFFVNPESSLYLELYDRQVLSARVVSVSTRSSWDPQPMSFMISAQIPHSIDLGTFGRR